MCARYTLRRAQLARAVFEALLTPDFEEFSERPHFNMAPSQRLPIVRINSKGERVIETPAWGFIPSWAKALPKVRPCNARSETLATSGLFRAALTRHRCLIPADGFYEWTGEKKARQPYFVHMKDDSLFAFGGLYDRWKTPEGESVETFTMITTPPNGVMSKLHDRMPLIVKPGDYAHWLDPKGGADTVNNLLEPYPDEPMEAYPVSTKVNSPKNQGEELVKRFVKEKEGLFD
jgi:putative SOS response-associated peptidase YedK